MTNIPSIPLASVIKPVSGRAGSSTTVPVYSVTKHRGFVPSLEYFNKQVFGRDLSSYKLVSKGQFAYATIHLDEGSIGIAPEDALVSPMYTVFEADQTQIDPGYLIRLLKSPFAISRYQRLGRGTAERRKSISIEALGALRIPLPRVAEQRRIAAIFDQIVEARRARREAIASLEALTASELRQLLQGYDKSWHRTSLGELSALQGGLQVSKSRSALPIEVPYLRVANVGRSTITLTEVKTLYATKTEALRTRLRKDDILVVEGHGNPHEVGRVARWLLDESDMVHQNHLIRVRFDRSEVDPVFAENYLNSAEVRRHWNRVAKTTSGLNTINMQNVRDVPMVVPPLRVQNEFAGRASQVASLRAVHDHHLEILDELATATSHHFFGHGGRLPDVLAEQ